MASSVSVGVESREDTGKKIVVGGNFTSSVNLIFVCLCTCMFLLQLQADWSVNLGDHVISIGTPPRLPGKPSQLLVLGERGVFCCLDTGQLRFMMKLEVNPRCAYPYGVVDLSECELMGE